MIAHSIFFYFFSVIAIVSAIMVTASKNTVHSVFFLILDFISISCLFIMIGAEFLGMIMLIVYVGAVAVLFLFVVMMLNVAQQKNQWFLSKSSSNHIPIGLIISAISIRTIRCFLMKQRSPLITRRPKMNTGTLKSFLCSMVHHCGTRAMTLSA